MWVNNTVVGTVTAMPPNTTTIYTHQITGLNFSDEVVISFTNKASSNKRMTIDNIAILTLGTATNEIMTVDLVDEDSGTGAQRVQCGCRPVHDQSSCPAVWW